MTLREIRKSMKITQGELATAAQINPAIISQVETGALIASAVQERRIERALDLPINAIDWPKMDRTARTNFRRKVKASQRRIAMVRARG